MQACLLWGLLRFGKENNNLKKRKVQHVAKISCRNSAEGEYQEEKGNFRREKCNMLQKSLVEMALRVNIRKEKAILEEKSATCCKNLL